jgi:hypothetical protein
MPGIPGNAAADHDPGQVPLATQFLAGVVQSPRQLHAAVFGIDHDLDAVQRVAFGLVIADVTVIRDGLPVVPFHGRIEVQHETAGRSHQLAVAFHADLSLGKHLQLALDLFLLPGRHAGEAFLLQGHERLVIVPRQRPHTDFPFEFIEID